MKRIVVVMTNDPFLDNDDSNTKIALS
jgi:hypothetical protein